MRPQVVRVHIQSLVLENVSPADRHRIGDGVQAELRRLLVEAGLPPRVASARELNAGSFAVSSPRSFGAQVAQAIYGGLSR